LSSQLEHPHSEPEQGERTPAKGKSPPVRAFWSSRIIRVVRIPALIYLGTVAVLFSLQTRMIFPGADTQGQVLAEVRPRPGTELVTLITSRGERVVALYGGALLPNGQPHPDSALRPTMIFFYGNAMCLNYATGQLEEFRRLGLNVLIPDYVGYGMSSGRPSEKGCRATALAAYDYVVSTRKVDPTQIVAAGWSLGGAVAIDLASQRQVGGLIAFSSFTSAVEMGRQMLPFVPISLLLRHRFDNVQKIARITCPTLIGHGRRDQLIRFEMGEELAAKAGGPVTTLWIDRAEHNDFFDVGGQQIDDAIATFVRKLSQPNK
jgi:pimeloyl-ACP methyl ester carboxylesterase